VIKETLRLFPPAPAVPRETMEDTNIGGYDIPKGTRLFISVWSVHQNEEWYPEPTVFKPERWDDTGDEDKKRPAYAWLPFGLGPHKCIGNFISFASSQ
jgi:cytochrome P450